MLNWPLMNDNVDKTDVECLIAFLQKENIFTQSKQVRELERLWSEWLGVKYSVFVNSGSSANFITMHIIAELYGKGDIITSPIAWSSDVASIMNAGHNPVFVDIGFETLAMKEELIIKAITPNTKAVFLTHVLGFDGLTDNLLNELNNRNILLIEDCCESPGADHNGNKVGTFSKASNFSFYFAHHMTTIEGGMICTDDEDFYQYARLFRSHGMSRECDNLSYREKLEANSQNTYPEFTFLLPGFNMRSTELNAVIGINQLKRLDQNNASRCMNFKLFLENLDPHKYYTDFKTEGSVNYAFVLMLRKQNKEKFESLAALLKSENVEFRRGTAGGGNLTRQKFVQNVYPEIKPENYPNAEQIHESALYIGNYPGLEQKKIIELCNILNKL